MKKELILCTSLPYPMGVKRTENGIRVCASFSQAKNCGIILYDDRNKRGKSVTFGEEHRYGNVFCAEIIGDTDKYKYYMLFEGKRVFCDPYARFILGLDKWGRNVDESDLFCRIDDPEYDWENDRRPATAYENSFVYTLHVRGYTKSPTSGIELHKRGTYKALMEKIDYIKSLGVTAVELMPTYEMSVLDESLKSRVNGGNMPEGSMSVQPDKNSKMVISDNGSFKKAESVRKKINFWGFKKGYYFAPRTAYSFYPDEADTEFKDMVKLFHKNGIEVIMQFYFDYDEKEDLISSAIRHWVFNYHIDGVHIKGNTNAPALISADPALSDIKIWYYGFDYGKLYGSKAPVKRTLGEFMTDYMYATRRFLKGDDNSIGDFLRVMLNNKPEA